MVYERVKFEANARDQAPRSSLIELWSCKIEIDIKVTATCLWCPDSVQEVFGHHVITLIVCAKFQHCSLGTQNATVSINEKTIHDRLCLKFSAPITIRCFSNSSSSVYSIWCMRVSTLGKTLGQNTDVVWTGKIWGKGKVQHMVTSSRRQYATV